MNKDKKYVFEIIVRETENLEKICSTITACDYTFEELKGRKADLEILNCKDILLDHLPKKELEKYFKDSKNHSDLKKSDTCNAPKNSIFGEEYRKKIAEGNWDKLQKPNIGYCTNSETNETPSNNADQDTAEKQYKKVMHDAIKAYTDHFRNPETYGIGAFQKTNNEEIEDSNYFKEKLKEILEPYVGKENTQELRDEICMVVEKELPKIVKDNSKEFEEVCCGYMRISDGEIYIKDKKTNTFYNPLGQDYKNKGPLVNAYAEEIMNRLVKKGCFRKIYKE